MFKYHLVFIYLLTYLSHFLLYSHCLFSFFNSNQFHSSLSFSICLIYCIMFIYFMFLFSFPLSAGIYFSLFSFNVLFFLVAPVFPTCLLFSVFLQSCLNAIGYCPLSLFSHSYVFLFLFSYSLFLVKQNTNSICLVPWFLLLSLSILSVYFLFLLIYFLQLLFSSWFVSLSSSICLVPSLPSILFR